MATSPIIRITFLEHQKWRKNPIWRKGGGEVTDLITAKTRDFRSIKLDETGGKLYWYSHRKKTIQRIALDGQI